LTSGEQKTEKPEAVQEAVRYIAARFQLTNAQMQALKKLDQSWWRKCAQAIRVSNLRGYKLDIDIAGFLSGKPNPGVMMTHRHLIELSTGIYRHIIMVKIKI